MSCGVHKVQCKFWIDRDIYNEFRGLVFQIHNKLYGVLSEEATRAIELWIDVHKDLGSSRYKHGFKINKRILKLLKLVYLFDQVSTRELKEIISQNIGLDQRTIKKYIEFLETNKFVIERKNLAGGFKIYDVNKDKIFVYLTASGIKVDRIKANNEKIEKETAKTLQNRIETAIKLLDIFEKDVIDLSLDEYRTKILIRYIHKIKNTLACAEDTTVASTTSSISTR